MKVSKKAIYTRVRALPSIKFEDQQLTSFAGLVIFQKLFQLLDFRGKLERCLSHLPRKGGYRAVSIVHWLVVHILLGYRKLRDVDFYRDDPMVKHSLGLKIIPSVPTISRSLSELDEQSVANLQEMNRGEVLEGLEANAIRRVTMDFDGSVLSTQRRCEGAAVGFNKKKKGARSYYPLFSVVAQTGQVFDVLHRSGNVHDCNGAMEFTRECIESVRRRMPAAILESRMDSAFFNDDQVRLLGELGVEFTISVPFERFAELKEIIEQRHKWAPVSGTEGKIRFFETRWKPKSWKRRSRILIIRKEVALQRKGPLQLDLFQPIDHRYEYKVIVTNKTGKAKGIVRFHEGRGQQENVYSEIKSQAAMNYVPGRRWITNKAYLVCNILAHNLGRQLQMRMRQPERATTEQRQPLWVFEELESLRKKIVQRAGRLTRTNGTRHLIMNANRAVQSAISHYLGKTL